MWQFDVVWPYDKFEVTANRGWEILLGAKNRRCEQNIRNFCFSVTFDKTGLHEMSREPCINKPIWCFLSSWNNIRTSICLLSRTRQNEAIPRNSETPQAIITLRLGNPLTIIMVCYPLRQCDHLLSRPMIIAQGHYSTEQRIVVC